MSSSSSSESEISASSSKFDPLKALYSKKTKVPVQNAPLYDNLQQFESAQKYKSSSIIPVGHHELVKTREEEKEAKRKEEARLLEEKNKQRFAKYEGTFEVMFLLLFVINGAGNDRFYFCLSQYCEYVHILTYVYFH